MIFEVIGRIKGKQRPRFFRGHAYTPKETKDYEELIAQSFKAQGGQMGEYSEIQILALFHIPKSYSKAKAKELNEAPATKKPDGDNILKVVADALNGVAWEDDKTICDMSIKKRWTSGEERLVIYVS